MRAHAKIQSSPSLLSHCIPLAQNVNHFQEKKLLEIYLVLNGVTFDKRFLLNLPAPEFGPSPQAQLSEGDPFQIQASTAPVDLSAWQISLFKIRF